LELPGGVVQLITTPIVFPLDLATTTTSYNLTGFLGALFTTNRTEEVSEEKSITIFAPINEAFMALGSAISSMTAEELSGKYTRPQ
jgi:transforming growth factor-beta-induced protein